MFTGLIESVGRVARVEQMPGGIRLHVASSLAARVGGRRQHRPQRRVPDRGHARDGRRSPRRSRRRRCGSPTWGTSWKARPVNLERPLRPDARLGGHFVQGHVDATGEVTGIEEEGEFWRFSFTYPDELAPLFIPKGSIAVDGISLTVAALRDGEFDVADHPAHVGRDEPARAPRGRAREPRVRHAGQVRRPLRGDRRLGRGAAAMSARRVSAATRKGTTPMTSPLRIAKGARRPALAVCRHRGRDRRLPARRDDHRRRRRGP